MRLNSALSERRPVVPDIRDVVEWDVASWSKAIAFWQSHADLRAPLECLEIGARTGGVSLWLASLGHRVTCSDLRASRETAGPLLQRYELVNRVTFEDIDTRAIPYRERFDVVAFKSVLGAVAPDGDISRQHEAVMSMWRSLKPGGYLLFAENLLGSPIHRLARDRFVPWVRRWRYVTIGEMHELLRPFRALQYDTTGVLGSFGRSEPQRRALALLDNVIMNRIFPPGWNYIIYGVAIK
jgi:SAM-dependent methyltransferase